MSNKTDYRRISVAVHGDWGSGKTWFADTAPGPRLILDYEGGSMDTQSPKVFWDPMDAPPAESDLTKDTSVVVNVTDWTQVDMAIKVLKSGKHPFNSVVLDSLTEMQSLCKRNISEGVGTIFDQQKWGKLLDMMAEHIRSLRDLTWPNSPRQVNVVIVMGSDTEAHPAIPLLQGALRKSIPGWVDVLGFMRDALGSDGMDIRVMDIVTGDAQAKCRLHAVRDVNGKVIVSPDMKTMIQQVNA